MKFSPVCWWRALLSVAWLGSIAALALNRTFYREAMLSPYFACVLLAACVLHLSAAPRWDALAVAGSAFLLALLEMGGRHFFPGRALLVVALASLLGMSSLALLGFRVFWASGKRQVDLLRVFIPAVLFCVSEWFAPDLLDLTTRLHPRTLDLFLYSFEASLRIQFSFVAGRLLLHLPWLRLTALLFYLALPIPLTVTYTAQLKRSVRAAVPMIVTFLITGPLGVVFYNLFPGTGPVHLFGRGFPFDPLTTAQAARLIVEPVPVAGYRNAIPSLHMAWVLLAWWNSRGLSWRIRLFALVFVCFTVLATLGTGEHYLIDLVAAFPFAIMVQALATYSVPLTQRRRWLPLAGGLASVLAWFALLRFTPRFFWASPLLPWSMMALSLLVSAGLLHLLNPTEGAPELVAPPAAHDGAPALAHQETIPE
jgi:hypothetical protein